VVEEAAPIVERQLSSKKVVGEEETNVAPLAKFRDDCSDALNKADVWLSAEMGAWENKLSNFGQIPSEQLPAATRLREEVERRLTTIQATVNPFTEALENEQRAVVDLTREIVLYRAGEAAALTDAILASSWVTVLSAKGVRAHLAESALATIEAEANEWLMVLSCGTMSVEFPATREVKGQTKEEIKTIIKSVAADGSEESRDLLTYSGGERRRINLAVDLGVAAAFSRGGLALSLLVLDEEVFSGMDEHGKAAVVHALHGAGIADVVIVDHDPRLSSTLPRTIRVTRGGDGFSEIEEVSP
jgi:DNA repair exonuclease SbcCD ATPase subunit